MVFSSIEFLFLFLPAFLLLYFCLLRLGNYVLLLASLLFYAAGEGWAVGIMAASVLWNFIFGLIISDAARQNRRAWLTLGLTGNLMLLGYFKYLGFFSVSLFGDSAQFSAFATEIALPIGISFFTFQAMSYLVDIYRNDAPVERSILRLGTYITMFPQLVAGPIVRYASVSVALQNRVITLKNLYYGFGFFAIGLSAKVLLADGLAPYADKVFSADPALLRGDTSMIGIVTYALQIYYDFLGYSLMAVGLGLILGFRFGQNFNLPYIAQSMTEFWRRWHISLSTWFRDYVYIPLGGNRHSAGRTLVNLWIVFLLTGLWHGASWNFLAWGMFHGLFLSVERAGVANILSQAPQFLRHLYVLTVVGVSWVLFRTSDLGHAKEYLVSLGRMDGDVNPWLYLNHEIILTLIAAILFCVPGIARCIGKGVELPRFSECPEHPGTRPVVLGLGLFTFLFALSAAKILAGSYSPFIYFRF